MAQRHQKYPLTHAVADFLDDCRARQRSPETIRWYEDKLDRFLLWAHTEGIKALEDCDRVTARRFLAQLGGKAGPYTLNGYIETLKRLANWAIKDERLDRHPWTRLEKVKTPKDLPRTLSRVEVSRFLKACAGRTKLRDRAMALFMYDSGSRLGEVRRLTLAAIQWDGGYAVVQGKGNKERLVPLSEVALKALKDYLKYERRPRLEGESRVFLTYDGTPIVDIHYNVAKHFAQIARRAGLPRANPHMWRHTAATEMLRNGANTVAVQKILGHEHISTTEIYTHLVSADMLAAHRLVSPASRLLSRV